MSSARYGTKGRPLRVTTNSFEITKLPTKPFYHYDVVISPPVIQRREREIISRLQVIHADVFTPRAVYDGKANLYSSHQLRLESGEVGSFDVNMSERPPRPGVPARGLFKVTLTRAAAAVIQPSDVQALMQGGTATASTATATNLLQLLIRAAPNMKYPHNSKSYFTSVGSRPIGKGIELWTGYFQSVRPSIGRMLVNIDVTMATMFLPGSLIACALEIISSRDLKDLYMSSRDEKFRQLKSTFKDLFVTVNVADTKRKKKIRGLVEYAGEFEFRKTDGHGNEIETTVKEHYASAYNIRLRHSKAFGIRVGGKFNGTVFPAELCDIDPGQIMKKKVPPELTKSVVDFATRRPEQRLNTIVSGADRNNKHQPPVLEYQNSDFIRDAGMQISRQPLQIDGRVLDVPVVEYAQGSAIQPSQGKWNVVRQRFCKPGKVAQWAVVNFSDLSSEFIEGFARNLADCCQKLGIVLPPGPPSYQAGNGISVMSTLDAVNRRPSSPEEHVLFIIMLSANAADVRRQVKQWGDIKMGVITQCIRQNKIQKSREKQYRPSDQYCNNVCLKLNSRLGGLNSKARASVLDRLAKGPFMIVGADIGHPGPGVQNQPSVASLVWSHDLHATEYVAFSSVQPPRQETFGDLGYLMLKALVQFSQKHKTPPRRIVFYRDGVSEGEFAEVAKEEIRSIEDAIEQLWEKAPANVKRFTIDLTFIVVGKGHHVRFFPNGPTEDKSGNCPAGFVADRGLSSPFALDFFLQSHGGLLGTSRPAHYIVLKDDIFQNSIDDLQELSFALCHVYVRATRSVSIPAPVYYADLVCTRSKDFYFPDELRYGDDVTVTSGGQSTLDMEKWDKGFYGKRIHDSMKTKMFFL